MIKKITITNLASNQILTFLDFQRYKEKYGSNSFKISERIDNQVNDLTFRLTSGAFSGFGIDGIANNVISQAGINQDGSDFLGNYWNNRIINFGYEGFNISSATIGNSDELISQVMFHKNTTLRIDVEGSSKEVFLLCAEAGSGLGTVNVECFGALWKITAGNLLEKIVTFNGDTYLPALRPKIYFGDGIYDNQLIIDPVSSVIFPIIEIEAGNVALTNPRIENISTGEFIGINGIFPKGQKIIIDNNSRQILYGETFITDFDGDFFSLNPPSTILELTADGSYDGATLGVRFFDETPGVG